MKINDKTQPQRLLEMMEYLVKNDGEITKGRKLSAHHHLDPRALTFMQQKGIIERHSKRGAIYWSTKQPDHDMAVLVAREFNKWIRDKQRKDKPSTYSLNVLEERKKKKEVLGYRLNIFGLKIPLRKPVLRIEKIYKPF